MERSTKLNKPSITVDFRERSSGIPHILNRIGSNVNLVFLKTGDYIINNQIVIERKSASDFIMSLITGRLFSQCSLLKKSPYQPLIMLEGDLYHTGHQIEKNAIKGALLSLAASWQIPLIYSENPQESARLMLMLANQQIQRNQCVKFLGYKSKRLNNRRLQFLQGLPNTGSAIARNLLDYFGNIESIINADVSRLRAVPGVGKKIAERIRTFVSESNR